MFTFQTTNVNILKTLSRWKCADLNVNKLKSLKVVNKNTEDDNEGGWEGGDEDGDEGCDEGGDEGGDVKGGVKVE